MAYSRYRRKPRRTYGKSGPKRRSSARRSRYTGKTRRYTRKPRMSRRSILNTTSEKKRDKLLPYSNSTSSSQSGSATYTINPAVLTGGSSDPALFVWCATARDNTISSTGGRGTKFDQATRTSSTCYMVGLSEHIQIQCSDGLPWEWRRVCFTAKAGATLDRTLTLGTAAGSAYATALETNSGWVRLLNQILLTDRTAFYGLFFQGVQNTDWTDPLMAKVDSERLTVKYDKTITLASGNEEGFIRKYARYHPMGKNLVYADDEAGGTQVQSSFSVQAKAGMGDYWVVDFFRPRSGSTAANQLIFSTESTLYWHEK